MTTSEAPDPTSASKQPGENSNPPEYKPNWKVIVPVVLISAAVLLVCLPICALLIVNSTGCCLNGPENVVTFWASMMAGFLALFGMLITGVFVITSLRVEATARAQAQTAARDEVWTYIKNYRKKLADDLSALESLVGNLKEEVKERGEKAMQALAEAQEDVETRQEEAGRAIEAARNETTTAASQAQEAVAEALDETTNAATGAQEAIGKAVQEVQSHREGAIRAIDDARQEAEAAARTVRELADRATGGPTQREGGPEQSDE